MAYLNDWSSPEYPVAGCRKCGSIDIEYRIWESSDEAHEDIHYRCNNCEHNWWIDGDDG